MTNEREFLETMAKNNEDSLRFIAKDMNNLARMLKKTPFEMEEKFKANLVQASFYLNAYTVATKAFNKMVNEKEEDQTNTRNLVDYFMDEVVSMQDRAMKAEKAEKAKGEKDE